MREAILKRLQRVMLPLGFVAAAALAVSTSGCLALVSGTHSTDVTFPLDRKPGGNSFWAWNEITVDQDINSVNSAKLIGVTLAIESPEGADFSFLSSITGEAVTPSGRTTVVKLDSIPPGEPSVALAILYLDDLHPLFKDQHTIRIEWTGATNPAFTNWPVGGYSIKATMQIDIE
jgi:hypothetical protein